jgi:hypothetical protein
MQDGRSGPWKDVWLGVGVLVGLMSGIASIIREWLTVFHPSATNAGRIFEASPWTCFVSCGVVIVIVRQRSAMVSFERKESEVERYREEAKQVHRTFGVLMNEGRELSDKMVRLPESEFGTWFLEREDWKIRVCQALIDIDLPTEPAAFGHAAEKAPPRTGVEDSRVWRTFYLGEMTCYRDQIQQFMERRLPNPIAILPSPTRGP